MQALQGMDPDKMVIIFPTALIAMYLIIRVQKTLSERSNPYPGLILPALCFVVSTILAFRPLWILDGNESDGVFLFCLRMWLTFNISTLVFLFPYYRHRRYLRAVAKQQAEEKQAEQKQAAQRPSEPELLQNKDQSENQSESQSESQNEDINDKEDKETASF